MILILANRQARYNAGIHGGFLNVCPAPAMFYGPALCGIDAERCRTFDKKLSVNQIARDINADLIVIYRGSMGDMKWLNAPDFPCPYIVIDVDFCYLRDRADRDELHQRAAIHFLRHPSDLPYSTNRHAMCLPFSVDPTIYSYAPWNGRLASVCLSGATKSTRTYSVRRQAMEALNVVKSRRGLSPPAQSRFYQQHMAAMTCNAGPWKYLNAKHFEIPACGTVLFTPGNNDVEEYLPDNCYVVYREDCSDICEKWQDVLDHPGLWAKRAKTAARHVARKHNHRCRWQQLIDILSRERIYSGGNT